MLRHQFMAKRAIFNGRPRVQDVAERGRDAERLKQTLPDRVRVGDQRAALLNRRNFR